MRGRLLLLALPALVGCVPASMEKLESSGETVVIASPLHWQDAYRRLNTQMQACLHAPSLLAATMAVDGQVYDELRMGEITATFPTGPFSSRSGPVARVQVRPVESGASVTIMNATGFPAIARLPKQARMWLDGSTDCR